MIQVLVTLSDRLTQGLDRLAPEILPLLARLVFAGVLFGYFWSSALTKLGPGLLTPSVGAYAQIFPRALEAAGYDASQLGLWPRLVVLAGTWAEFVLPLMIVAGLLARLAALGMIGFVVVQSLTDVVGHGVTGAALGGWFDRVPDALIVDQRALWTMLLLVIVMLGAGGLSADRWLQSVRRKQPRGQKT
ncbi:MAG: DoxX family membrane protein [Pseudotabrizicola sp.]|uniref:DoxX family membrane protein n=1 Tax=Pseudotabrizicola sp. TaxID=2939647 RepID=UPI0027240E37|nr:DoxX family membrane protein [Pseudotabrizicola sp.]MDO8881617.1 DoxX family membrane protein [Pseudotabrizicola sp.]MDP2080837.1 DoxX family membrane protein [Pseudotabrizicola sp.]MDZ7572761.1 DoxX family membrane protein [Pseudotabrizicola sp.]